MSRKHSTFLALAMLEAQSQLDHPLHPHMSTLPQSKDLTTMPIFWNDEDRSMLRNCCSEFDSTLLEVEVKCWADEFNLLKTLLDEFPYSPEQWYWARANIVSRNMQIPQDIFSGVFSLDELCSGDGEVSGAEEVEVKHLSKSQKKRNKKKKSKQNGVKSDTIPIIVPLADMANHSSNPSVTWRLDPDEKIFEMKSIRALVLCIYLPPTSFQAVSLFVSITLLTSYQ
jgi:hypothetical protein